jgi:hypothetical protein
MQSEHLDHFHRDETIASTAMKKPDEDEMQPLLFDLVKANEADIVNGLFEEVRKLHRTVQKGLAQCAARFGSISMVELFPITPDLCKSAIEGNNPDTFRYMLSQREGALEGFKLYLMKDVISCQSEEIFEEYSKYVDRVIARGETTRVLEYNSEETIASTAGDPYREQLLILLWKKILKTMNTSDAGDTLANVARTTCSVELAKALIDHSAPVDHRGRKNRLTPLHLAARKTTQAAAELMKFLLFCGADPTAKAPKDQLPIREKKGPMGISKWLGISWDELVTQAKEERAKQEGIVS